MQEISDDERLERQRLIQRLQAELRTEEMRLVLIKKLRQTQLIAAQQQQLSLAAAAAASGGAADSSSKSSGNRRSPITNLLP